LIIRNPSATTHRVRCPALLRAPIASYQLRERVATRAGDQETAAVARQNRKEEEAMAAKIAGTWDKAAALSLEQEGVTA
jgi:ferritin-like metal-binding protein YciE